MKLQLIKIYGADRPGITAKIVSQVDEFSGKVTDIEQAVTHGLLSLMVLVELPEANKQSFSDALDASLKSFQLSVQIEDVESKSAPKADRERFVVTVIASDIPTRFLTLLTKAIASASSNIDSLRKLSSGSLSTIELICSSGERVNLAELTDELLLIASEFSGLDLALQKEGLYRRSKRLVVFDMDSTLIQGEIIDELADILGKKGEVSALTRRAMEGEMDFQESLIRRVGLLRGIHRSQLEKVYSEVKLSPGAKRLVTVLKRLGYKIAIISGGFTFFVDRLKHDLGVHYAQANTLEIENDLVTGRLKGVIVDGRRKADLMELIAQQEGILLDQVIAIGDGANDMQMLKKAGLGIAFNAKAFTKSMIGTSLTHKSMDSILYFLGITDLDLKEMDLA